MVSTLLSASTRWPARTRGMPHIRHRRTESCTAWLPSRLQRQGQRTRGLRRPLDRNQIRHQRGCRRGSPDHPGRAIDPIDCQHLTVKIQSRLGRCTQLSGIAHQRLSGFLQ
ncbi:hypothetical protein ACFFX0_31670 [Citricoccus parietis]|uniref:Uncharacterized protein n=1 Tax=Citricoccus parietis TaxID=592307 RepID=A0ABV5GAK5_9MICC